ncbi:TIGR02757 family protein [Perlabentimonas gracilis]|uniref:TIGR02757 family protein n=1 Tax=Perlabentimonas gracilis TaxID=2715279 RepID=UPI00293C03FD|nr:TIGR02757 family protein [Perlabentimonas gracilis]
MGGISTNDIKQFLDEKYLQYASPQFIETDPIQIPKAYSRKEDIEIAGFLAATISWGQRPQIIKSAKKLMEQMGESPYEFIIDSTNNDIKALSSFYYRTFNGTDCTAFLKSLKKIYCNDKSIESLFTNGYIATRTIKGAINHFRCSFIDDSFPKRSTKHLSNPMAGSAAKRINMFLRWMVRPPKENVDFGLWASIPPSALMLPLDVHSGRVARRLGILNRKQSDWKAVEEVTAKLRTFDPSDPIKYDFALFGLGVFEKF